jgi:thiol:disulfide interchange protein DsbC
LSITGSTISNRNEGIRITGGGTDPVISNNDLSNDFASVYVDGAIDGADADPAPQIKAAVESWLQGRYKVENLRRSPVPGIWEVQVNTDLLYVDEKAMHAFVEGQLIDLKTSRNLTQERIDELTAIQFKDLPLAIAIKQVNGKGTRRVAVFEDPNCGYCRTLRKDLVSMPDVTIYTFTLPILSADSVLKLRQA